MSYISSAVPRRLPSDHRHTIDAVRSDLLSAFLKWLEGDRFAGEALQEIASTISALKQLAELERTGLTSRRGGGGKP